MALRNVFGAIALDATLTLVRDKVEAVRVLLAGTLKVQTPIPTGIVTGQLALAANTIVRLPDAALVNGLVIKTAATNTAAVLIGPTGLTTAVDGTGAGYPLAAGEAFSFAVANANAIYARSTAAAIIYFGGN